jgi:8-oxo-dGTP pyrophosphatase MutT (NUDIX family)
MAYVGLRNYVVVVLHVGSFKASYTKIVLHREPRTCKTWFLAGSILPKEEHVEAIIRELLEETSLTLTPDELTLLCNNAVRVLLRGG